MILQALKEYYERKDDIAPEGWEKKEIPFIIILDNDGHLVNVEKTTESVGKKKIAKTFIIPKTVNRSANTKANLLWDKAEYVFEGIDVKKDVKKDKEKFKEQREAFISEIENKLGSVESIKPLLDFLRSNPTEELKKNFYWAEIKKDNPNLTFRFNNELNLICRRKEVIEKINLIIKEEAKSGGDVGICLISGQSGAIAKTHRKTWINRKNNSLISFQKNSGYDSYRKQQGHNAPISKSSEDAYAAALKTLLKSERQRFSIGDGVYVCWSADKTNFETEFLKFFDDPQTRDNPDLFSENVKALFKSIDSGAFVEDEGTQRFYLLGLSPGGGTRISVRFWDSKTVSEYAANIRRYFNDFSIVKPTNYPEYFSIWRLLVSVAQQGKSDNIPPHLAGELVYSIICGLPYPETLLQAAIRRTRAGIKRKAKNGGEIIERVTPEIAAIIKAYLNRSHDSNKNYMEVNMSLDTSNLSPGYRLGRLFAALEKLQSEANMGINSTIRDRFYGAACSTPVAVFATLLRLQKNHLAKLENRGRAIYFEKLFGEITSEIKDFPSYLSLHEQGLFALGYYHQRQELFIKKQKER